MLSLRKVLGISIVVVAVLSADAWAWGPATHVKLASDLLAGLELLPAGVAAILASYRRHYIFGNVAADVVVAKRLSRVRQFCHHWQTGFAILDDARSDAGRAFALGYLSHLAADTVAHCKFLPRQMTVTRTTMSFGHLYWELRADTSIGPHYWQVLRGIMDEVFAEHEASLSARLTDTFLPFALNWQLFYRMNHFVSRRSWLRAMTGWSNLSRWHLSDQLMREYRAESLERMIDVLAHQRSAAVLKEDPNGNAALAYARVQRRQLRQMARAGLVAPHVLHEAEVIHAPR
ncbi:MAG: zinc dependent phospholipase C family protein, partial [Planctomycetes bacterium]|nr:zinc dependent phospholipase C family protein [Planctomycetota bacterium]